MNSKIKAISYYLPDKILTNKELAECPNSEPESVLYKLTGVKERRILDRKIIPSDFALASFRHFLEKHPGINKNDIDFLIYCSEGTDYRSPSTAAVIQQKCGLQKTTGAFDLSLSCSGYVYGLLLAHSLIASGNARNVLFIAQGVPSWVIHNENIQMRALFGDASSCTLISTSESEGIGKFVTGTDGSGEDALRVISSSANDPLDADWFGTENNNDYLPYGRMEMKGIDIFSFSLEIVPGLISETLQKNKLTIDQIDLFVFHQANGFMLEMLRRKIGIPEEKFFMFMEEVGNTVSASIPLCLAQADEKGLLKEGKKVLIAGFGSGFSWGCTVVTF